MTENLREGGVSMLHYFNQIASGFSFKAGLGALAGLYAEHMAGDWVLVVILSVAVFIDLVFGVWRAVAEGRFSVSRLRDWMLKYLTYNLTIFVVGMINATLLRVSGRLSLGISILDIFVAIMIITEAVSILENMARLGLPVPVFATKLVDNLYKKTSQKLDRFTAPDEDARKGENHDDKS